MEIVVRIHLNPDDFYRLELVIGFEVHYFSVWKITDMNFFLFLMQMKVCYYKVIYYAALIGAV